MNIGIGLKKTAYTSEAYDYFFIILFFSKIFFL